MTEHLMAGAGVGTEELQLGDPVRLASLTCDDRLDGALSIYLLSRALVRNDDYSWRQVFNVPFFREIGKLKLAATGFVAKPFVQA